MTHYNVSPIAITFFLVYAVSFFLYKTKRIKISLHRKIWNVLLLASFLVTGIFGLILTIQLDYKLPFAIPFDLLFWHVEAGIVMTLISLFHVGWHFNYYRNLVRAVRNRARTEHATEGGRRPSQAPGAALLPGGGAVPGVAAVSGRGAMRDETVRDAPAVSRVADMPRRAAGRDAEQRRLAWEAREAQRAHRRQRPIGRPEFGPEM